MTPLKADEETLGKKHIEYNKLVQDAVANNKPLDTKTFVPDKHDLDNLLKIDIAGHNKDVDYVISVLKSEDMLYVSRALKQSAWLVDDEYAYIINPDYLRDNLFPEMTSKASTKLLKHIRHHIKTDTRAEQFYNNEKSLKAGARWLRHCSIPFVETKIQNHMQHLQNLEFKRLCEKSVTIFEAAMKTDASSRKMKAASFLLHTHVNKYLDVLESTPVYNRPSLGPKATEVIMNQTPDRIINNFIQYLRVIDVPTFVRYLKREQIKDFIFKIANKEHEDLDEHHYRLLCQYDIMKHFIKRMAKEEQFDFVKKIFLDKASILNIEDESLTPGSEMCAIKRICVTSTNPIYCWYQFAPFDVAFDEITKLMQSETCAAEKFTMLKTLLNCACEDSKHLQTLLTYYNKNHLKDDFYKNEFVNKLISQTKIYKYDDANWKAVNEIFTNMNVYTENNNKEYANVIVMYHILQNKPVPESIEKKYSFDTLKKYRLTLNQEEQHKIFDYLYQYMMNKIESFNIENEAKFDEAIEVLQNLLKLLIDWEKNILDYPIALNKIKELIQIKKDNSWKINLSPLYNTKKSWRKHLFEESVILSPCQAVCVNALKHDPELLVRYKSEVDAICTDDTISLKQLLRKLRIYWPESLADNWTKYYYSRLEVLGGQKAVTRGICTLLSQEPLLNIITKYAPEHAKVDWDNTDELTLGLQRCIAKNMHIARPQPSPDAILLYAKGDFLQYALPSVLAIYNNLGTIKSQEYIPKLLNAPVSLQKHGLRLAFVKLKHEDLKYHLANIWKTSKNISIRAVTFVLMFELLCKQKDNATRATELWEILEVFIDNLSFQEDKKIYDKLPKVDQIPDDIKPKFLIKSYKFLKNMLPHIKTDRQSYEYDVKRLAVYTRTLMENICPEFVADIITEYLNEKFFNPEEHSLNGDMVGVISSYLLCAKDEETQTKKFEKILAPLIKRSLDQWNETHDGNYFIRRHFQELLTYFSEDLKDYVIPNKMIIPIKMFTTVQKELERSLVVSENYLMLTMWKLIANITELMTKNEKRESWNEVCDQMMPECSKICLEFLKEDVKLYFPCIYILYAKVLNMTIRNILSEIYSLQVYELMLSDRDFIQGYLVTLKMFADRCYTLDNGEEHDKEVEIRKKIREHPSVEVRMHYYNVFKIEHGNEEF